MNVFVDTSAVLRVLLNQPDPVACWGRWECAFVSDLLHTEFHRTIDRLRLDGSLNDSKRVEIALDFAVFFHSCNRVPLSSIVLARAAESFPTVLGTLDAIHLATLLLIQQETGMALTLLSHDEQLRRAALASGVAVW